MQGLAIIGFRCVLRHEVAEIASAYQFHARFLRQCPCIDGECAGGDHPRGIALVIRPSRQCFLHGLYANAAHIAFCLYRDASPVFAQDKVGTIIPGDCGKFCCVALGAEQSGEKFFKFRAAELVKLASFCMTIRLLPSVSLALLFRQSVVLRFGKSHRVSQMANLRVFLGRWLTGMRRRRGLAFDSLPHHPRNAAEKQHEE